MKHFDPNDPRLIPVDGRPRRVHDREFVIVTPWEKPMLSMNDSGASRGAVMARAEVIRNLRASMRLLCRRERVPKGCEFVEVGLHYLPDKVRVRDSDNLASTLKPLCDAIAGGSNRSPGYGVVPDDDPRWMGKPEPTIYKPIPGVRGRVWLVLRVWEKEEV